MKNSKNLFDLIRSAAEKYGQKPFLAQKDTQGIYQWTSYYEIYDRVENFSSGLAQLGIGPQDHIGIIMKNSVEWVIAAFAAYRLGAVFTPIHHKELPQTWINIIQQSELKAIILHDEEVHAQIASALESFHPSIIPIIVNTDGTHGFQDIEAKGKKHPVEASPSHPDQRTHLIHTSGTIGEPKGIFLTHTNVLSVIFSLKNHFPHLSEGEERAFSIFPWAHIAGLVDELFFGIFLGAAIAVMDTRTTFVKDFQNVQPSVIATAPIVLNRFYKKIHEEINQRSAWKQSLFRIALAAGRRKRETQKETLKYKMLNHFILKAVRNALGGRLKMAVVGGAAMSPDAANFFRDIGTEIYNGYGLTETSGMLTFNSPLFPNKVNSVGKPLRNMRVTIANGKNDKPETNGEIIAYGPNIASLSFYRRTIQPLPKTEDGGFRTGDIGKWDNEGYLYIVGRKKEEYKLTNGKYIYPSGIEEEIKLNQYVKNAFVYGDNQKYNVCLIVPLFENLKDLTTRLNISSASHYDLIKEPLVQEFLKTEIMNHLSHKFTYHEIPRKCLFTQENFSIENGLLTNTFKLKRDKILEKYQYDLLQLYQDDNHEQTG
jgi:long-chain acyl-CoA synthetase